MSYGVEAPILLCSDCVAWDACLAGVLRICFFPRLTIWVTSLGFCAAEFAPPHPRFYPMFPGVTKWSASAQPSRSRSGVHNSGATEPCCCLDRYIFLHSLTSFLRTSIYASRYRACASRRDLVTDK